MESDSDKNQFDPFKIVVLVATGIATAMCSFTQVFRVVSESKELAAKDGVRRGFIDQTNEVFGRIDSKEKVTTEIACRREKLKKLETEYNTISHLKIIIRKNLMCRIANEKKAIQYLEQIEQKWNCIISYENDSKYYLGEKEKTFKLFKGKREYLQENADECVRRKQETEREIQELEMKIIAIDEAEAKYIEKTEEMECTKLKNVKWILGRSVMVRVLILLFICGLCYAVYRLGVF